MPTVNIPDIGVVSFPDSMSYEDISTAIRDHIIPQARRPEAPAEAAPAPAAPTAESQGRSVFDRNIADPLVRGFQGVGQGLDVFRGLNRDAWYGMSPEDAARSVVDRQAIIDARAPTEASQAAMRAARESGSVLGAVSKIAGSASATGDVLGESIGANPIAGGITAASAILPVPGVRQLLGALAGVAGFPTEFVSHYGDALMKAAEAKGVDPKDPARLTALIREMGSDEALRTSIRNDAAKRAGIIAAVDAVAGGAAGKLVTRGALPRIGGAAAIEGGGGGAGEALAQLATGDKLDRVEIAAEIVGGGVMGGAANMKRSAPPPVAAPGTRGEDEELRGALTAEGGTRPPGPTVTLPAAMFSVPGEDTGAGVNTVAAPLKGWLDDYVALKYPGELATAEAEALAAHRTATGDPAATLSPEAAATAREAFAVNLADTLLQTSISNEPGRKKAAALQTATDAVVAAEKTLADVKATPETGDISAQLKRSGEIADAESALKRAQAAKADVETTMANEAAAKQAADDAAAKQAADAAAAKQAADDAAAKQAADDAAAANKTFTDALDVAAEQEKVIEAARLAEEERALGAAVVSDASRGFPALVSPRPQPLTIAELMAANAREEAVKTRAKDDAATSDASRGFPALVPPRPPPLNLAEQMAANVEANKPAEEYTRTTDAGYAAARAEREQKQAAEVALANQALADAEAELAAREAEKDAIALAETKAEAAREAEKAANALAETKAEAERAAFRDESLHPGGVPKGDPPLNMAQIFQQNKIDNEAQKAAQEKKDAAQKRVTAARAKKEAAQAKVTAETANMDALREGVRATTSAAETTPSLTPTQQRAANVADNKVAEEYGRTTDAGYAAARAETTRIAAAQAKVAAEAANVDAILKAARATRGQASARGSTAAPAAVSTPVTAATADPALAAAEATALAARRDKAFEVIKDRLEKMRARGAQGAILADNLEAELKSGVLTPAELYLAFQASSVMAIQLPAGANHDIKFVPLILVSEVSPEALAASGGTGGLTLAGTRKAPTAPGLRGLIKLSLEPQFASFMQETAAHEAFHVVQDYIASYDQSAARQIDRDFRDGMSLADVEGTLRRKLELARMPSGESYWAELQKAFGDKTFSSGEMQALVFGALADANRRGVPMTGTKPPYTRLVLALRQFFQRLGGALRGDGFTNTADMLNLIGEGSASRFDTRAAPIGTGKVQAALAPAGLGAQSSQAANAQAFHNMVQGNQLKSSWSDVLFSKLIGRMPGEGTGAAIVRTSINLAAPMHNLDTMAAGNGYTGRSAGKAMELAMMNSGRLWQIFKSGGIHYDPKTGAITIRRDIKPLLDVFKDNDVTVQNKSIFQGYAAARQERDLRKTGRVGFLPATDQQIQDTIAQEEAAHPKWVTAVNELQKHNEGLLDFAIATGILAKDKADDLRMAFYTPLYRVMDAANRADPTRMSSNVIGADFAHIASALDVERKGGTRPLNDLFENIIGNADSIIRAGLKNVAAKLAADTMVFAKLGEVNTTGVRDANTITYRVDGNNVDFNVRDPVLFSVLANMPREIQNGIYNTMAWAAHVFRDFVTAMPSFILTSLYRGKGMAYVQEGQSPLTNTLGGFRDALTASTSLQNYQMMTGFGGNTFGQGDRNMARGFERQLTDEGMFKAIAKGRLLSGIRQGFGTLQAWSEAAEMAERLKLSETLQKRGSSDMDAAYGAYLMAPYSRRGTGEGRLGSSLQFLIPLVPFLNAKLQTTYRLIENEKGDKRSIWTLGLPQQIFLRGLVVTAFSLMAYSLNVAGDDDEWNETPDYVKLAYDIIPVPGGGRITLPRFYEVGGIFGALPVFMLDAIRRGESKDLGDALITVGLNTFWMNPTPKALAPIVEMYANRDFFKGRLIESQADQGLPVGERANRDTSYTARAAAGAINTVSGDAISPAKMQALLGGYTGILGATLMSGLDSILAAAGAVPTKPSSAFGSPAADALAKVFGAGSIYRDDANYTKSLDEYYRIKEAVDQLVRSQNRAKENHDFDRLQELAGDAGLPLRLKAVVNNAATQMDAINKQISRHERSDADPDYRRDAIRVLTNRRTAIARRVVEQAKAAGAF